MPINRLSRHPRSFHAAFSLVEVTISLGIVAFALVGVLGALPLAMNSGRYSFEQTRAASIANTMFAKLRAQTYSQISYLSSDGTSAARAGDTIDLSSYSSKVDTIDFTKTKERAYASITDGMTTGEAIQFQSTAAGAEFGVLLGFNALPTNATVSGTSETTMPVIGMANQVELVVYALDHPKDFHRYVSVIARHAQ